MANAEKLRKDGLAETIAAHQSIEPTDDRHREDIGDQVRKAHDEARHMSAGAAKPLDVVTVAQFVEDPKTTLDKLSADLVIDEEMGTVNPSNLALDDELFDEHHDEPELEDGNGDEGEDKPEPIPEEKVEEEKPKPKPKPKPAKRKTKR